jgi:hypothetical protein
MVGVGLRGDVWLYQEAMRRRREKKERKKKTIVQKGQLVNSFT